MRIPRALQHALLYGCSIALMKGVSLLMLPFIAQQLSTDDFGRLEVAGSLAILGSIIIGLGLEDSLYRFAGAQHDPQARRRVAAVVYTLTLSAAAILLPLCSWFAGWLSVHMPGQLSQYQITLVLVVLTLEGAIAVPLGWLRMRDRAWAFFTLTIGRAGLQALLTVLFLLHERGVTGVLEAGVASALVQATALAILQYRDSGLALQRKLIRQVLIYGLPLVASGLLGFAYSGLDRWLLADQLSLTDAAHFGIAAKFALATVLLLQPYGMWWMPKRFTVLFGEHGVERAAYYNTVGIVLALLVMVAVGLSAPMLIHWLMPAAYAPAAGYAVVLVVAAGLKEITEFISLSCLAGQTTGLQVFINAAGAVCAVILMLLLTPRWGAWGVCWALAGTQLLRLLAFSFVGQQQRPLPYPVSALLMLTALALLLLWLNDASQLNSTRLATSVLAITLMALAAVRLKLIPVPSGAKRWRAAQ
jgi:O-antigen/teichoic acid export membrane protein